MYNNSLVKVKELYSDIASTFNIETEQTNKLATETYNLLTNVTQGVTTLKNKISVLGDMLTDLRVLNGSAKNIIPLTNLKVIENKGIKIKDSKFELDYITNELKEIDASLSSLTSVSTYKLYTIDGKESYLNDLIKTKTEIEVKFPNKNFTFDLNLRYQTQEQINTIVLQLGLLTEAYPDILSIKYVDHENNLKDIIILDTNTRNYSLNDNRVKDNLYIFSITPVVTDQIIIQLASRESDSVLLKGIETYYSNILSNGYIILGPISTEDPILKLAVDSSTITEGIKIEVSTDKNYWIELNNSSSIGLNGTKKILSINTIGSNSIKNDQDIYSMYVKISIQSSVLSNENLDVSVYNTLREDSTIGNDLLNTIENIRLSAYRVSSSDYSYGKYMYNNITNLATLPLDRIEYIQNNGISKVLGLVDTKYSITDTNNTSNVTGSIGAELKLKRMVANSTLDADTYDVANCKLYDIYPRKINEIVNTRQKDNLCLMLKQTNKNIEVPTGSIVIPPDSCEGAIDRIMVGAITDGGLIDVYVDDVLVVAESSFMFRLNGIAPALADFDIEVTPYDGSGNEITVENVPGRYYSVDRALFKNLSNVYKKIRIVTIDADSVNTNYTPENATFDFDSTTGITTFCLAHNVPPIEEPVWDITIVMTNIAEDIYTITGSQSKKSLKLDLTTPFVINSSATIINVNFEDIIIKNSIGEIVAEINKEDLLTIEDEDSINYFLNLVDILFDPIEIEGFVYSKLYPLKELNDNEYGLLDGKIITGKDVIVTIKGYELLKSTVDVNKVVNYYNGNYIKRLDDNFTYYHEQYYSTNDLKSVIKLDNVAIEKGSLYLEEYLEDGEQYTSDITDNTKFLNVNTKENPKYIITDETNPDEYLQE